MKIISLGSSCSVAFNLEKTNLKQESLPFDWIRSSRFSSVNKMLNENFKELWKLDNYNYLRTSDKFFIKKDNQKNQFIKTRIYQNINYQINFYHDFPDNIDFMISFQEFKKKYQRRCCRFINFLKSNNSIIFIRDQLKLNHLNILDIDDFFEIIKKINPELKFKLIIIVNNPKNKSINHLLNYDNDNLIIIEDNQEFKSWERENILKPVIESIHC